MDESGALDSASDISSDPARSTIPELLRARLTELRPLLSRRSSVLARREQDRRPVYRLRLLLPGPDGSGRHASIVLGDLETATAVRSLITNWKQMHRRGLREMREAACAERRMQQAFRRQLRQMRREAQQLAGGGRCRRRAVGKRFDEAVTAGPRMLWAFFAFHEYAWPNRRSGRPHKHGLTPPCLGLKG